MLDEQDQGVAESFLVLPSAFRGGEYFYTDTDLAGVKLARQIGLNAYYPDPPGNRRVLGEHSSGFMLAVAVGVTADIGAATAIAIAKYAWATLLQAIRAGLVAKPEDVDVAISIDKIEKDGTRVTIEGLRMTARGDAAVERVLQTLAPALNVDSTASDIRSEVNGAMPDPAEREE